MKSEARIEYKYYLPTYLEHEFLAELKLFTRLDHYANRDRGGYDVASIYYDTMELCSYHEKIEGMAKRLKLRLRFYLPEVLNQFFNVELKHRVFDRIVKMKTIISGKEMEVLLKEDSPMVDPQHVNPTIAYLSRRVIQEYYQPFVRIDYFRKPFYDIHDPDLRITIDSQIYCARFYGNLFLKPDIPVVNEGLHVLEIKSPNYCPFWLKTLIEKYKLDRISISKYLLSVQNLAVNSSFFSK